MNLKSTAASAKLAYHLEDPHARAETVAAIQYGATKYEPGDWRQHGYDEATRDLYFSAIERHLAAWRQGERYDGESGLPALAHVAASVHFLLALEPHTPLAERLPVAIERAAAAKRRTDPVYR